MKISYICSRCGKEEAVTSRKPRCECGGLWKLSFTPPKFSLDLIDLESVSLPGIYAASRRVLAGNQPRRRNDAGYGIR